MAMATGGERGDATDEAGDAPLVVRPSPRRIRRDMVVTAVLAVVVVALLLLNRDPGDWVARALLVVVFPASLGLTIRTWRRLLAADALLEVGPAGVRINELGHGWVTLPWSAVGRVTLGWPYETLVVRLVPGVGPSTPGTVWPPESAGLRWRRRFGFRLPLRFSDSPSHLVLAAVQRHRPPA